MLPVSNTDLAVGTGTFPVLFVVLTLVTPETSYILLLNNGCVVVRCIQGICIWLK